MSGMLAILKLNGEPIQRVSDAGTTVMGGRVEATTKTTELVMEPY
jgi:hypothetical protein